MTAIYPQIRPRHKRTSITKQENRRPPILLRGTKPAQHILRGPIGLALGIALEQLSHHLRDDVAGRQAVDADIVHPPFGSEVAGELEDGGFGGVVGGADETLGGS